MIKRFGVLLALVAIIVAACSSGGSSPSAAAPSAAAPSAAASEAASEAMSEAPSEAASAGAGAATLVIWADDKRAAAIKPLAQQWASDNGVDVQVQAISEDLTTQFKTASQQGTGPDIVVWAHDVIGDFVQNGAIDPVQMPDTSRLRPARGQGHDLQRPALRRAVLGREHRADPQHGPGARTARPSSRTWSATGKQLVKDKKAQNIMALQVGQKGDAYHIYPLFTSGGGSYFGTTSTGDPDPTNVTVDSAESDRRRPEAGRPRREGRRRPQALDRRQERDPAVHRRQGPVPHLRPVGHLRHQQGRHQLRHLRDPLVRGRQARVAVHRRQRLLPRQQGQEQGPRPGVPLERRPDARVPAGPLRRGPATSRPYGGRRRRSRPPTPTSRSSRTRRQRHDPARDPGDGPGLGPVRHGRGGDRRRRRPRDRPQVGRQGHPGRHRHPVSPVIASPRASRPGGPSGPPGRRAGGPIDRPRRIGASMGDGGGA